MNKSDFQDKIAALKERFRYVSDPEQFGQRDHWELLEEKGEAVGDCEDFSLTLLRECYGSIFNAYRKGARVVFCYHRGNGHAIMKNEHGYADNIQRSIFHEHKDYTGLREVGLLTVYYKIISADIKKFFS